ncbi:hypothetical protein [Erythrobacter sp. WG]|uniref:hypothetical protein n=1 Tax=Erythrobacter sp. WG TaxID=2985510 RepID=UPI00226DC04A|nr:hypothetical protein [Erythrobacter sp. WG]MCX9146506.1 hypothetical protein [Erythrobacter sp. WG]
MDFMKLLKSLEELLYEVMVMLVFFPRTLYLTARYPQRMMDYADTELGDVQSEQYSDTLSPPLFLMICLALSHGFEMAFPSPGTQSLPSFLQDTQNLLMFRVFMFSLVPLILSLRLLNRMGIPLDRETLRPVFYSQCFITAPMTLVIGIATILWQIGDETTSLVGHVIFWGGLAWYLVQQTLWFRVKLGIGYVRAAADALGATVAAAALIIVTAVTLGFMFARDMAT